MEKWNHRSLEWIHKVREENYEKSRDQAPWNIVKESLEAASPFIQKLNLKTVYPEDIIPDLRIK